MRQLVQGAFQVAAYDGQMAALDLDDILRRRQIPCIRNTNLAAYDVTTASLDLDQRLAIRRVPGDQNEPLTVILWRLEIQHQPAAFHANRPCADLAPAAQSQDDLGTEGTPLFHITQVLAQV